MSQGRASKASRLVRCLDGLPARTKCSTADAAAAAGGKVLEATSIGAVLVTRSEQGMTLVQRDEEPLHFRERSSEVFDVSGAGDTRPGIVLGRDPKRRDRLPVALVGRVNCRVDADAGAIEVGDLLTTSPRPGHAMKAHDPARAFARSGIAEAARTAGGTIAHQNSTGTVKLDLGGAVLGHWEVLRPIVEADRLINVPVAKHHSISRLTLAMKNLMGVIGGNRRRLHHNIAESLSDIASVIHSDLTVVDATRILTANGPQGGRLQDVRKLDTLIASPDIVAADAYASTLFGLSPEQVPTVVAAARRGLGVMDLKQVRMV